MPKQTKKRMEFFFICGASPRGPFERPWMGLAGIYFYFLAGFPDLNFFRTFSQLLVKKLLFQASKTSQCIFRSTFHRYLARNSAWNGDLSTRMTKAGVPPITLNRGSFRACSRVDLGLTDTCNKRITMFMRSQRTFC